MLSMDVLCSTAQQWALACVRRYAQSTEIATGFTSHFFALCPRGSLQTHDIHRKARLRTDLALAYTPRPRNLFFLRADRVRPALPGVAETDPGRSRLQGRVPATARGATLRRWRRRRRGHCCRVNHDYVNTQLWKRPEGGAVGRRRRRELVLAPAPRHGTGPGCRRARP